MKKIYKKLTKDQTTRGVIFSSCLSTETTEQNNDTVHEVLQGDVDKHTVINRLLNDSFFDNSPYNYNIVRR